MVQIRRKEDATRHLQLSAAAKFACSEREEGRDAERDDELAGVRCGGGAGEGASDQSIDLLHQRCDFAALVFPLSLSLIPFLLSFQPHPRLHSPRIFVQLCSNIPTHPTRRNQTRETMFHVQTVEVRSSSVNACIVIRRRPRQTAPRTAHSWSVGSVPGLAQHRQKKGSLAVGSRIRTPVWCISNRETPQCIVPALSTDCRSCDVSSETKLCSYHILSEYRAPCSNDAARCMVQLHFWPTL
eukprot:3010251-Rhodomonas_salina.1